MKNQAVYFLLLLITGCISSEYKCTEDHKIIEDLNQAYTLVTPDNDKPFDIRTYKEKKVEVGLLREEAKKRNMQVKHYAMGQEDNLFCCRLCADKAKERINKYLEQRRLKSAEMEIQDSLFRDSLDKGLIKY